MAKEKVSKKATKKLSPYNNFIKAELAKVKKETPGISHKDAFKKAAENWKDSPENPKNKKDNAAPAAK
ncbi:hypothetical protein G6F46_005663 [Rhizopus delemar]|uniref:YABBY protein C-terminal domain-containing protein n=2 Tax=Rhizopus TaxID=4842 RepID=A0A9P6Z800_9FUNG|nr:hypothetical protein G6F43_006484 [Rhizopus delemar]KAG1544925.1 hypothetical protein G6F51_005766 [Rhizopus arrhizus]KAG1460323.1 hypothetical protein G6F55_004235 [Rhizopus delemar]KAG1498609.1 hypothetical protein G6F54_004965 [Rhizopus delemar]KAG1514405.1 hypothetical protein G6F53_003701 [Rhizopus delemar]